MKRFIVLIFLLYASLAMAQWPIQICNEPLNVSECTVNDSTPDYKTSMYQYMIFRDNYVQDVPLFGKNPATSNPSNTVDLRLDVYLPCNTEVLRPVVIMPRASHYSSPGGVTISGNNSKHRYILKELARKGFVGISLDYRSYKRITSPGYYVDITPGPSSAIDSCAYDSYLVGASDGTDHFFRCYKCLIEGEYEMEAEIFKKWMMYMNVQDMLSAVGYCLSDPGGLGINADPNNIFIGGLSNGGQIALTAAYLDEDEYDTDHEIQVKTALGSLRSNGYAESLPSDFEFKGAFNFWGSMHDLGHIDPDDPPTYSIHGTWDDTVPYQDNFLGFESTQEESHFYSFGSEAIACKLNEEGIDYGLYSVYRFGHGAFPLIDVCTPGVICGYNLPDYLIKKITNYMSKLVLYNNYPSSISGINPQDFDCNIAISQSLILDLYESNQSGECIQNPAHYPLNLSQMMEYCDCELAFKPEIEVSNVSKEFKSIRSEIELNIEPNPVDQNIEFIFLEEESYLRVFNMMGDLVFEKFKRQNSTLMIDVGHLASGSYVITTGLRNGKFIKL